jgi:3-hydroxyacyl-CoA dehydrogenase
MSGHNPRRIDEWSASKLLPLGQLSLLDDIGFDVVDAALENYISRGDGPPVEELQPLRDGLRSFITERKLGKKNNDGLLAGGGLAKPENGWVDGNEDSARKRFLYLFINECLKCVERFLLTEADLTRLLSAALLSEQSFREVLIEEGNDTVQRVLMDFYSLHGRSYFAPSGLLNYD